MTISIRTSSEVDQKRIDGDWGSLMWLASREMGNAHGLSLARVTIRKGKSNPPHSHPNCEEVLYLLRGTLEHFVGNEKVTMRAGDTLSVGPGLRHYAVNVGDEDADMIVAYSSGAREFETEPPCPSRD